MTASPTDTATNPEPPRRKNRLKAGVKLRDAAKFEQIPVRVETTELLRKPDWIRVRMGNGARIEHIKSILRSRKLATVCEEASCPNLGECFSGGTATFMIMGEICTRRCPFCDVGHGKPLPLDADEPGHLADAIAEMGLSYVVITSVDRDDLRDGGAGHFASCISEIRQRVESIRIEILTPDFRGRMEPALQLLSATPPDVFNHNLETVPRLYPEVRPGANFQWSLKLLSEYKARNPGVITKSGLMVGMGETMKEMKEVFQQMREHGIDMLTIGQYLQPSREHFPVRRYVHPDEFREYENHAYSVGFRQVASGPLVRSSYHADQLAQDQLAAR